MASKLIFLIGVCLLHGTWSYPSPAETSSTASATVSTGTGITAGTKMSDQLNQNIATLLGNTRKGFSSITNPLINIGVKRVPNTFNRAVQTATQGVSKLSEANKENTAKIASGVGKVVGGGMNLGSAMAGGLMTMAGSGIDAIGKVADSGANGAISIGGQMMDNGIAGLGTLTNMGEGTMDILGDGMTAAGAGVTVLTNGISQIIGSISDRMEQSIKNASDTITKLMKERATTTNANVATTAGNMQTAIYTSMQGYINMMMQAQNMFETMMNIINTGTTVTTASDGTATTVTAST